MDTLHVSRGLAVAVLLGLATVVALAEGAVGKPIRVTRDMRGAGIVSSGAPLPPIPPVTGSRASPVPSWGKPLPYPVLIADRRNNRLIEVTPDKRIVWEFPSPNLSVYRGNEDVKFSPDGKRLAVSEEDNYDLHIVDYETRTLSWTFGEPDVPGSGQRLNYPDDAHLLDDGSFLSADIRNCRVLIIDAKTDRIVTEWGRSGDCRHDPPRRFHSPNGATPLANGDILVTEIRGSWISRLTREGKLVWSVRAPGVRYPSDAFMTRDGQVIVADFSSPGSVVIFDPLTRNVSWAHRAKSGDAMLKNPSLARELPETGDIIVADDLRERVVVIDRATRQIIWQYGVTDQKGHAPGYLNYPDGFDIDVFRDWRAHAAGLR
ncbi:MAG TPA: PQQ-binding-like beta-propeller repeat protein [Burkholderiaceae bacterium]|nr:PQQ-binding-like beta-propeller repeat protein [Burkholderiaceae bacterium]